MRATAQQRPCRRESPAWSGRRPSSPTAAWLCAWGPGTPRSTLPLPASRTAGAAGWAGWTWSRSPSTSSPAAGPRRRRPAPHQGPGCLRRHRAPRKASSQLPGPSHSPPGRRCHQHSGSAMVQGRRRLERARLRGTAPSWWQAPRRAGLQQKGRGDSLHILFQELGPSLLGVDCHDRHTSPCMLNSPPSACVGWSVRRCCCCCCIHIPFSPKPPSPTVRHYCCYTGLNTADQAVDAIIMASFS
jgi:hypothetical protein